MKAFMPSVRKYSIPISIFVGCLATLIVIDAFDHALNNIAIVTGWLLFAIMFFQSCYQAQKKRQIKFGDSASWLGSHICMGSLSMYIFMHHIDWRIPDGVFEVFMTFVYTGTVISGLFGLAMYRILPRRFIKSSEEITLQRIPQHIRQLRRQAEHLALDSIDKRDTAILAYYYKYLLPFLLHPHFSVFHILGPSDRPIRGIKETESLVSHTLGAQDTDRVRTLLDIVKEKNRLDCQYTMKIAIKVWIFIHAPLAFSTVVLTIMHIAIVYAYMS